MKDNYLDVVNIQTQREILDWRDEQLINVESGLHTHYAHLYCELKEYVSGFDNTDLFLKKKLIGKHIDLIYSNWQSKTFSYFTKKSSSELLHISEKRIENIKQHINVSTDESFELDLESSLYTGAAIAAIPLAYHTSLVSVGGILGIFGITAISWPIAVVGAVVIGSLTVLGNKAIKQKKINQIINKAEQTFFEAVFTDKSFHTSLRSRLINTFNDMANQQIEALNNDPL